jgi:PAS domain S-box-containing protein
VPPRYEFRFIRKDGSTSWVEIHASEIEYRGRPAIQAAYIDITERKKAEEALRQSEERLKILFESAPDAIYLNDLKGNFVDGNKTAEKILGYAKVDLIGKNFVEMGLLSSEQVLKAVANLEKNTLGKPTGPDEYNLTRKDGSSVAVEIRSFPVKIGDRVLSLSIAHDICARKKAEQKLLEHRAQLKSLASELSLTEERERHRLATNLHDQISQALVISRIKLQTLHASVSSDDIAGSLEEVCGNLDRIIQDTRTLTFDLSSPILYELGFEAAVSEWLEEQIGKKHGIKTKFEDDGRSKPLEDDIQILLFRNVRELLMNIVKHARAKNVKVSIHRIRQQIYISVEDDGIGFDHTKMASSTGFGIFSIRERLEQLAGHIEIESEQGRGTKIMMTAPLKCENIKRR